MGTVIFRADGGGVYSVAMGHVFRTVRLAKVLAQRGTDCHFVMKDYLEGVRFVQEAGFPIYKINPHLSDQQAAELTVVFAKERKGVIFIDLRSSVTELVNTSNGESVPNIVYEDVCRKDIRPTILINPTPIAEDEEGYRGREGQKFFLGIDYQVLDPDLQRYARESFQAKINDLFLCFGGADPCNISSRVLSLLLELKGDFKITLALGPAFAFHDTVKEVLKSKDNDHRVTLFSNCKELHEIHGKADCAITAGGTIVYESVSLNIPTLVLPSIDYEANNMSPLIDMGLIDGLREDVANVPDDILEENIRSFIANEEKRFELFNNSIEHKLIGGTQRVIDKICSTLK
jgi:spore coat polysaccharide biosynthesis predicted glycosyltransferase SpsG